MSSLLQNVEENIKKRNLAKLRALEKLYKLDLLLYKQTKNLSSDVFGKYSGENFSDPVPINGMITGDDFFPSSNYSSTSFERGWLFTSSENIDEGDEVSVESQDGKVRKFKVSSTHSIGMTLDVFVKYELSATGD